MTNRYGEEWTASLLNPDRMLSGLSPQELLEEAGLRPGMAVVDYGCGPGLLTLLAAKTVSPCRQGVRARHPRRHGVSGRIEGRRGGTGERHGPAERWIGSARAGRCGRRHPVHSGVPLSGSREVRDRHWLTTLRDCSGSEVSRNARPVGRSSALTIRRMICSRPPAFGCDPAIPGSQPPVQGDGDQTLQPLAAMASPVTCRYARHSSRS